MLGATLLAEYEELIHRESLWRGVPVTVTERETLLDDFCAAAVWHPVYFRWRPNLQDADDDHVLELAIASGVEHLVRPLHNNSFVEKRRRKKYRVAPSTSTSSPCGMS